MEFHAWLQSKKIDPAAFNAGDPERYKVWSGEFMQMHPASFTARYLYQVNAVRRKFTLKPSAAVTETPAAKSRPVIRPKTT